MTTSTATRRALVLVTGDGRQPLVHVRQKGAGRVSYVQFGHDMRSWGEPGVRAIVRRAALCAAGEAP